MTTEIIERIISSVFIVLSFFAGKLRSSNKDSEKLGVFQGTMAEKVESIEKKIDRLETKLDNFSDSFNNSIDKKIKDHVEAYHNAGK